MVAMRANNQVKNVKETPRKKQAMEPSELIMDPLRFLKCSLLKQYFACYFEAILVDEFLKIKLYIPTYDLHSLS